MRAFVLGLFVFLFSLSLSSSAQARIQQMTDIINGIRQANGLGQLYWNDSLMTAAFVHARDMADQGYCNHGGLDDRVRYYGWQGQGYGEIVSCGADSAEAAIDGWLNSPFHRSLIFNGSFNHIGLSHYFGASGHRWAVIFGAWY